MLLSFFSIHLVIVTLYLQREQGVFNNNDKQGIGRQTERIREQKRAYYQANKARLREYKKTVQGEPPRTNS